MGICFIIPPILVLPGQFEYYIAYSKAFSFSTSAPGKMPYPYSKYNS
jgi:hypothetical protein